MFSLLVSFQYICVIVLTVLVFCLLVSSQYNCVIVFYFSIGNYQGHLPCAGFHCSELVEVRLDLFSDRELSCGTDHLGS